MNQKLKKITDLKNRLDDVEDSISQMAEVGKALMDTDHHKKYDLGMKIHMCSKSNIQEDIPNIIQSDSLADLMNQIKNTIKSNPCIDLSMDLKERHLLHILEYMSKELSDERNFLVRELNQLVGD